MRKSTIVIPSKPAHCHIHLGYARLNLEVNSKYRSQNCCADSHDFIGALCLGALLLVLYGCEVSLLHGFLLSESSKLGLAMFLVVNLSLLGNNNFQTHMPLGAQWRRRHWFVACLL